MIRYRKLEWPDIPAVVEMGRLMHDESPFFRQFEYDADEASNYAAYILENPESGFSIIAENDGKEIVGGMFGIVSKLSFCKKWFAHDLIAYIIPEHRKGFTGIKFIKEFEKWAAANGSTHVSIGFSTGIDTAKMLEFYSKLGYDVMSYKHVKELH